MSEGPPKVAELAGPGSVVVVIVNWNGRDHLPACLEALAAQDYDKPWRVVLVDNGSSDGSPEFVRREHPEVEVVESPENNYARANNLGAACAPKSEFLVCLNTDTRVAPSWLRELTRPLGLDEAVGGVTPLVLFEDGRVNSTGIETLPGFHWGDRGFASESAVGLEAGEVEGISGCSALWRRSCWDALKGLDEDFHMYYEDVDMSLRARAAGWKLWFTPLSRVHHLYNASIRKREAMETESRAPQYALKDRLGERNRLYVLARHYPALLLEALAASRFLMHEEEERVEAGLERVFEKWTLAGLGAVGRRELATLALRLRTVILERDAWARGTELELHFRDAKVRELSRHSEKVAHAQEAERRSWHARVRRLEDRLREHGAGVSRAESEALELRGQLTDQASAYEELRHCERAELDGVRTAYEAEIRHREEVIADLKRVLEERDSELAAERARPSRHPAGEGASPAGGT